MLSKLQSIEAYSGVLEKIALPCLRFLALIYNLMVSG
jgi:hypothetical protein